MTISITKHPDNFVLKNSVRKRIWCLNKKTCPGKRGRRVNLIFQCSYLWPRFSYDTGLSQLKRLLLLLLLLLSSSLSPLYRVITRMSPRQTMSLGDTLLQLPFFLLSIRCLVLISLFPTLVLMVFYVSTFRRMCAVPLLLLLLLLLLSPLCTVFTIIYLKQTVFLMHTVLQLFCIYSSCYM